ncbi:hypothetical protein ZORO111903_12635 [Zobellia roscoffensis]|uniref:hypothetical protein n=1 Tax=Zobellia roscoffensis TaxID=2779508 RepID=UPI00188B7BFC|nr:hypothetical protein [Zobellia roscoffensis]
MNTDKKDKLTCGVIMPISAIDNYSEGHWSEVFQIIKQSVESAGFETNLVSDADEVGIIQKRIIQNIYNNPIVVCDVSGKNPNVMFELGMRLAFDKPTIIIKDNITSYSFDTSPIEYLEYARDLRYQNITSFKEKLKDKILGTYKKSIDDPNYSTFLSEFGQFKVAQLSQKEVSTEQYLLQSFNDLRQEVKQLITRNVRSGVEKVAINTHSIEEHNILEEAWNKIIESSNEVELEENLSKVELAELIKKEVKSQGYNIPLPSILTFVDAKF